MTDHLAGRYQITELLAVAWNDDMASRFPNADHHGCRQEMWHDGTYWKTHNPPRCHGYHCNDCGSATNIMGHHNCGRHL